VAEILDGKGAGKKGRFQGKANKLQHRQLAKKLLKDFCAGRQSWTLVNAMIVVQLIQTHRHRHHFTGVTLNNASNYWTNGLYRTPNPNHGPFIR